MPGGKRKPAPGLTLFEEKKRGKETSTMKCFKKKKRRPSSSFKGGKEPREKGGGKGEWRVPCDFSGGKGRGRTRIKGL